MQEPERMVRSLIKNAPISLSFLFLGILTACGFGDDLIANVTVTPQATFCPSPTEFLTTPTPVQTLTLSTDPSSTLFFPTPTQSSFSPTPSPTKEEPTRENKNIEKQESIFKYVMGSFLKERDKIRNKRKVNDPEWVKRVDEVLNKDRINFILFGYGETYEPPRTVKPSIFIGSYSILSYNTRTFKLDIISISHDYVDPSLAEAQGRNPDDLNITDRIDQAKRIGGFEKMRKVLESATGLSADFQIAFSDVQMARIIDAAGGVDVTPEIMTNLYGYYLRGVFHEGSLYKKGETYHLSGDEAVGFIKSVPIPRYPEDYEKELEHNIRKEMIMNALKRTLIKKLNDKTPQFVINFLQFFARTLLEKEVEYDFEAPKLISQSLLNIISYIGKSAIMNEKIEIGFPDNGIEVYISDDKSGIPEVGQRHGLYGDMFIPEGANLKGEYLKDYWGPFRKLIKKILLYGQVSRSNQNREQADLLRIHGQNPIRDKKIVSRLKPKHNLTNSPRINNGRFHI